MKVFLAGATGVIGKPVVRQLLAAGHDVVGLTRDPAWATELEAAGVQPIVCDVFDHENLTAQLLSAKPDAVIHQMTAIPQRLDPRKIGTQLAATNRLRTEGTRILLQAAIAAGAERFIAQSIAFAYSPYGSGLRREEDALYDQAPPSFAAIIEAVQSLEDQVANCEQLKGIVLRYGFFHGPGTVYADDGTFAEDVRRRRVPIIGPGTGVFSFIHVDDAAAATVAALSDTRFTAYNIVDDHPMAVADWLPPYAAALNAPRPRRVPRWLARIVAGGYAVYLMCDLPGVSNERAKQALGWSPQHTMNAR